MANKKYIQESSGDIYDSPITFHGKPRKHKYPKNRKKRDVIEYKTPKKIQKRMEAIKHKESLASYAPLYSQIYTQSYSKSEIGHYLYIDFFVVCDGRIYKMTNLIANVMGWKILQSRQDTRAPYLCRVPYLKNPHNRDKMYVEIEEEAVKQLSLKMFGTPDGYFWQSLLKMYPHDIQRPEVKKTYIVNESSKPVKDYRVRRNTT